ncbi:hypothetical protein EI94DRAFT_1808328 [Lactarius quietus]|nr:hypothetical protein EI94DRAFT_1808328 [Lactarius quietus]
MARLVNAPRSSQDSSDHPIGIALTSGTKLAWWLQVPMDVNLNPLECRAPVMSPDFPKAPEEAEPGLHSPLLPPPAFNLNVLHGSWKSLLNTRASGQDAVPLRGVMARGDRDSQHFVMELAQSQALLSNNELELGRSINAQLRTEMGYCDDELADYLNIPLPRPASPFTSVSSTKALSSPPGLALQSSHEWRDSVTTALNTSGGVDSGIDMDLLEEAPPTAGKSWRQLATQGLPTLHERRTTFGLPMTLVHPRDLTTSEQGSLHSMRLHLSPHSTLSAAGSAPISNSTSEHSRRFTVNSFKSLAHSSSTDRCLV